ncbi:MAG: TrkH family potassium uptake protein [Nanobdellota archaeon]
MRLILNYLGYVLWLFSFFLLIPMPVALYRGEEVSYFIVAFLIAFILGLFLKRVATEMGEISEKLFPFKSITLTEGFVIVALSFIGISAIAMIPYFPVLEGTTLQVIQDAYFEGISGITTTGLSIIPDVSLIPKSVLLWRALTQWIGGMGIIMVFLFMIYKQRAQTEEDDTDTGSPIRLYQSLISTTTAPNVTRIMYKVGAMYAILTVLGIIALFVAGLPLFDSVTTSFTALSTGGFLVSDVFYQSMPVMIVTIILMIFGAISFIAHSNLISGKIKDFVNDMEFRSLIILLGAIFGLGIVLKVLGVVHVTFTALFFQLTSALTGTGFSVYPISLHHQLVAFIIILSMFIGGATCSTSGGIKQFRLIVILKSILWNIKKMSNPTSAIIPLKLNKKSFEVTSLALVQILVFSFLVMLCIGTAVLLACDFTLFDALFQALSALCTVGFSSVDIHGIPGLAKLTLMILMLLGRMEIFPFLVLIRKLFK